VVMGDGPKLFWLQVSSWTVNYTSCNIRLTILKKHTRLQVEVADEEKLLKAFTDARFSVLFLDVETIRRESLMVSYWIATWYKKTASPPERRPSGPICLQDDQGVNGHRPASRHDQGVDVDLGDFVVCHSQIANAHQGSYQDILINGAFSPKGI
jgi:hypothetical protein